MPDASRPATPFGSAGNDGKIAIPTLRQFSALYLVNFFRQVRILGAIRCEKFRPVLLGLRAALTDAGSKVVVDAVGHEKLRVFRPTVITLGEFDFFLAEGFAVGFGGVLFVRRTVSDVAVEHNERRPALGPAEYREGVIDALNVVGVADPQHIPTVREESGGDIFGKRDAGIAFDGDVVVVPNPTEVIEAEMACQRGSFGRDAFHHAAVTADGVDVVVEDVEARFVVSVGEPFLGDGHADTGGDALAERAGRGLDAGNPMVLRMARGLAVELTKSANILERNGGLTELLIVSIDCLNFGEVQDRPEQHRSVAVGKNEAIPVGPDRVLWIEIHRPVPDRVDQRRERHWRARMAGLGGLDRVNRERADCVDGELNHFVVVHGVLLSDSSAATLPKRRRCRGALLYSAAR